MTIKESLDVLAGWIEERTREKRYPESEVKELSKALLNIMDMAEDQLIRHKWPEEKPPTDGEYLVRLECGNKAVLPWYDGDFYLDDCLSINYIDGENPITHWWDLSEVMK